jgi:hypothetical protein
LEIWVKNQDPKWVSKTQIDLKCWTNLGKHCP